MPATPATATATFYPLTVSFLGAGLGSVNSLPSGVSLTTGSLVGCDTGFVSGSTVTLIPTPSMTTNRYMSFGGWSVPPCAITTDNGCLVIVPSLPITVQFDEVLLPVLLVPVSMPFGQIQAAYTAASTQSIIQVQGVTLSENLHFNQPIAVTLLGGYDAGFLTNSAMTTVQGSVVIQSGTVMFENIIIK